MGQHHANLRDIHNLLVRILAVLHDISTAVQQEPRPLDPVPPTANDGPEGEDALLTMQEAGDLLSVPVTTLRSWRYQGKGPPSMKVGRSVRYSRAQVIDWVRTQACNDPTAARAQPLRWMPQTPLKTASTREREHCSGSHTEPKGPSSYPGRAVCRACGDDVIVNRNGLLRKHVSLYLPGSR